MNKMSLKLLLLFTITKQIIISSAQSNLNWGPLWRTGPSKYPIIELNTTFTPGKPPTPAVPLLAVWAGLTNGTGDLVQTVFTNNHLWCNASDSQWCVRATVYHNGTQLLGTGSAKVNGTEEVLINYKVGSDGNTWTQNVAIIGSVVSTYTCKSGPMLYLDFATETQQKNTGTVDYQYYRDTTIVLQEIDPSFGISRYFENGAKDDGIRTSDGGKTWFVKTVTLPPMH